MKSNDDDYEQYARNEDGANLWAMYADADGDGDDGDVCCDIYIYMEACPSDFLPAVLGGKIRLEPKWLCICSLISKGKYPNPPSSININP